MAFIVAVSGCSALPEEGGSVLAAPASPGTVLPGVEVDGALSALSVLEQLAVKGRAPKTGYARSAFGAAWTDANTVLWGGNSLSTREDILSRDLVNITCKVRSSVAAASPPCVVQTGVLHDPYTGTTSNFVRGEATSPLVPIEHVVALSDSWQKGAQQLSVAERVNLANDPLNLIATTQAPNMAKGDSDAASWLPPNKTFRCAYVARQVAVKFRYRLWVTEAEKTAIASVLSTCPGQPIASDTEAANRIQ
ncbi:HNH endonuclease family protein [Rhodococcus sp. ARC_M12]|uniref:HNH endonuclease family protein n=1 Tax=Rhodococcus sp. ARC_M12 TaxID=2928854 RepID=UPI001FB2A740|nr:HNH endonuclease family protein [Rhodococcus sp. ARC_M12]MCJ0980482.1 HNH endonuclease family protein [Rhodococcus sp. ARC_M12]